MGTCLQDNRLFFTWTFWRVTTPFREVTFADFLLADILTSLAKALSDCERALCHLSIGPVMQPHDTDEVRASPNLHPHTHSDSYGYNLGKVFLQSVQKHGYKHNEQHRPATINWTVLPEEFVKNSCLLYL